MNKNVPAPMGSNTPARQSDFDPPPYEAPYQPWDEGGGGFSLKSLLPALRRYWWVLTLAGIVGLGAGYGAYKWVTPVYSAEGAIWITTEGRDAQLTGPISQGGLLESSAWIELLTSYAVLDPVVLQERLYLSNAPSDTTLFRGFGLAEQFRPGEFKLLVAEDGRGYTLSTDQDYVLEEGVLGDPIGAQLGFQWSPPAALFSAGQEVTFSVVTPRDAARSLAARLTPSMDRQGNFITLELRGANPVKTARVLNAVMERHVEVAADLKRAKLDELTGILKEQLTTVEQDLHQAEQELESYQVRTITLPSEEASPIVPGLEQTRAPVMGEFFQLRMDQDALTRDRERLQAALSQAQASGVRVENFEMIPSVGESSELVAALDELTTARADLRGLQERYTDEYGPVAELIRRVQTLETTTIPRMAQALLEQLRSRESELAGLLESRADELSEIPPRAIEEARRQRRLQMANDFYIELTRRYETASLAAASSIPDVRILSDAVVPRLAASDQRIQFGVLFFLGSLGIGVLVVMLLDRFDPKLRDPADIGPDIGLEWLGAIPRYRKAAIGGDNSEEIREAFRDLRMKLDYAAGMAGPFLLSITSPAPGEGKTFVSANLASAFADLGRKTILVDGDTRRGDLHHVLGMNRKPGLTDFLMNGGSANVIQETGNPKLHFVGFGSRTTSSPELLNSANMQNFLAGLKRRYEVVIFDCPPMAAGSDAFVLGAHAGNVLIVLRSGSTNKELAAAKMDSFLRLPVRILGGVLNDFTPHLGQGYYRYYSHYLPGYQTSDERETEAGVGVE